MKSSNKNETIIVIVFTIILVVILGIIVYTAYTSTNNLESNTQNQEKVDQNNTPPNSVPKTNIVVPDKSTEPNVPSTPIPVETQIAYFSSNIYDHDLNRVFNIELATKKINGTIIKKGEIFSFNDTVGAMGEKEGFKEAIGFDTNGNKIKMFGGGMCQISSTIYNTALISNLEIVERHPHSRRVYYVPKDKDATVYYNTLDLKIKNNTDSDIKIIATSTNSNVTIILNKITSGI
jgi:vancomycin resistance protein YoaR